MYPRFFGKIIPLYVSKTGLGFLGINGRYCRNEILVFIWKLVIEKYYVLIIQFMTIIITMIISWQAKEAGNDENDDDEDYDHDEDDNEDKW